MGAYEIVLTVVFSLLCIVFVLYAVKACRQSTRESDPKQRKQSRKKTLLWSSIALVFLLCALYLLFRISWFMLLVMIAGTVAVGLVIGNGIAANAREH